MTGPAQPVPSSSAPAEFRRWHAGLIDEALRKGFERGLVAEALGAVEPLPQVLRADRAQAGPSPGLEAYLAQRLTPALVTRGREQMRTHRALLGRIERWFGVQRRFVVAIWGAETG
jgi:membrane-bound lytic murein transglycosylase B